MMGTSLLPMVIQGGMGVGVSGWRLAKAISRAGQLGVVSGTGLDVMLVRRLEEGDPGGAMRSALAAMPCPKVAENILSRYFIAGGKEPNAPYSPTKRLSIHPTREQLELIVAANFVEVYLAKERHSGIVGINYLQKIEVPTLPSLFGAMLAGVDYVLMGAGIPVAIPEMIDLLSRGESASLPITGIHGAARDEYFMHFDPADFLEGPIPELKRPKFLAIVASATLASMLLRRAKGPIDGFVVEGPKAGGHNAPPRGQLKLNESNEPIYGERDHVSLEAMRKLDRPFWLAGAYGTPERLQEALQAGASGVQVGTPFAFCEESGLSADLKHQVMELNRDDQLKITTDPLASPTGFPFKILHLEGTLSDAEEFADRKRICDLGFLSQGYVREDGTLGWRCPAEPVEAFLRKGGTLEETKGRRCICNGLVSNIGIGQIRRDGSAELPLVTSGSEICSLKKCLTTPDSQSYTASDVLSYLLSIAHASPLESLNQRKPASSCPSLVSQTVALRQAPE